MVSPRVARNGLIILTLINLFNYLDRYLLSGLIESLKRSALSLSDSQIGLLGSAFMMSYIVAAPLFGVLADRVVRSRLISAGIAVWSLATALSGLAGGFLSLLAARAVVGIGEAAYGSAGPSLIADYYAPRFRSRAFAMYSAAIPIGVAAGYIVAGVVDQQLGWRSAFFVAGLPGVFLALLALRLANPTRGSSDNQVSSAPSPVTTSWQTYRFLMKNRSYRLTVFGYAAYTFALGALALWTPPFLERVRGIPKTQATIAFGSIVVVTGFLGTFLGGWLAGRLLPRFSQANLWVSGLSTLLAAPVAVIAFASTNSAVYFPALVVVQILLFLSTGPVNSAIVTAVGTHERARAVALSIVLIHLLGDVPSPPLIGLLSDLFSLQKAFLILPVAMLVAGVVWTFAAWSCEGTLNRSKQSSP